MIEDFVIGIIFGMFGCALITEIVLIALLIRKPARKKRRYKKLVKDIGEKVDVIKELEALSEKLVEPSTPSIPPPSTEKSSPPQEKELPFSLLDVVFKKNFRGENK